MLYALCLLPFLTRGSGNVGQSPTKNKVEIYGSVKPIVAPGEKIEVALNTIDAPVVHISAFPIDPVKWLIHPRNQPQRPPHPIGPAVWQGDARLGPSKTANGGSHLSYLKTVQLPGRKVGMYLLEFEAKGVRTTSVVNVSNVFLTVKRSPYRLLVWATDVRSGAVVKQAQVRWLNPAGKSLAQGRTGMDGVCVMPMRPSDGYVQVSKGADSALVEADINDPDGRFKGFILTDRPLYRPGQTVNFKAILRRTKGQGYSVVANTPVKVCIIDSRQTVLDRQTLRSNDRGTVAGAFKIPLHGALHYYEIRILLGDESEDGFFQVEEYRKPDFKVDVKPERKRYFGGQVIHFSIDASYYFGAPVGKATVRWQVTKSPTTYFWHDMGDGASKNLFNTPGFDTAAFDTRTTGTGVTDSHGHIDVVVHTPPGGYDSTYTIGAHVTDSSRRSIDALGEVGCYAAALRVGVFSSKEMVLLGDSIPVEVRLEDLDGHPLDRAVQVEAFEERFDNRTGQWSVGRKIGRTVGTTAGGRVSLKLPALSLGQISLVASATDDDGRTAQDVASTDVVSKGDTSSASSVQPRLDLSLDKSTYRPGDTVHATITTNRTKMPVLLVETGGDIWGYKVIYPTRGFASWSFPANADQSPTAYLTAYQSGRYSRVGTKPIYLLDPRKKLDVKVVPDKKEYRPGGEASLRVHVTNSYGKGVQGELALTVADESIFALAAHTADDVYSTFWGYRMDAVSTYVPGYDGPVSMGPGGAGGRAPQMSLPAMAEEALVNGSPMIAGESAQGPKVRKSFQDTAYWNAFVETDASGYGDVRFFLPDDLGSWRASGSAITRETRGGDGHTNFTSTRPVTFRLAAPRIVAEGDQISVLGTVNNRTPIDRTFDVELSAQGAQLDGPARKSIFVKANGSTTESWKLKADQVPGSGAFILTGRAMAEGGSGPEDGDALEISVPVVPRGVSERSLTGGVVGKTAHADLELPADVLTQGSLLTISVYGGLGATVKESAQRILDAAPYGSMSGVDALKAAVATHVPARSDAVLEAIAEISKDHNETGWGWWFGCQTSEPTTAEVGYTLALASRAGYPIDDQMRILTAADCSALYAKTNRWEDKARLAASMWVLGAASAPKRIGEVLAHGQKISPFAKLRMAEVLASSNRSKALKIVDEVMPFISQGAETSSLPVGVELGWTASSTQTSAELLIVLHKLNIKPELQQPLAKMLAIPGPMEYRSLDEEADVVSALAQYNSTHPDARKIGDATVTVNGHAFHLTHSTASESASVEIREPVLNAGKNAIELSRTGDGEAFYTIQAQTYRPSLSESNKGVRIARRFETRNGAGIWIEVKSPIPAGSEVRCTVVVWGDDISDGMKVTEPVPAGFEFIEDAETDASLNEEQRDGAIIHYLLNAGTPVVFQYYLRAETDGTLIALPAIGEYLRRPGVRGHSSAIDIVVKP